MKIYYYDDVEGDCRLPHDSGSSVTEQQLSKLGVIARHFPVGTDKAAEDVDEFARERKYAHRDEITVSPDAMGAIYEDKIRTFFHEHMHEDEEIRYILRGKGYFDVRAQGDDRWVRILCEPGDLLVLPSGIYHRFTVDTDNAIKPFPPPGGQDERDVLLTGYFQYINAMRLFQTEPKWTPLNRGPDTDVNEFRKAYVEKRDG